MLFLWGICLPHKSAIALFCLHESDKSDKHCASETDRPSAQQKGKALMNDIIDNLWTFKTARFTLSCDALVEDYPDLSWDETSEVAEKINAGEYMLFCARVTVYLDGREIASDYLGNCVYEPGSFETDHRGPDPMNRNCTFMRAARGRNVVICHYFPDMVRAAIAEARKVLADVPVMRGAA